MVFPFLEGIMKKRTLDDVIADREKLDAEYWKRSDKLQDEFERLMEEDSSQELHRL